MKTNLDPNGLKTYRTTKEPKVAIQPAKDTNILEFHSLSKGIIRRGHRQISADIGSRRATNRDQVPLVLSAHEIRNQG